MDPNNNPPTRILRVPNGVRRPNTHSVHLPCPADNPVIFLNRTVRSSSGERRPVTVTPPVVVDRIVRVPIGTRR